MSTWPGQFRSCPSHGIFFSRSTHMASNNQDNEGNKKGSSNRGFASMDPQRQREIASEGGRAAHRAGTAHEFTSEEAREAGRQSHKNDPGQSGNQGGSQGGSRASGSRGSADDEDDQGSGSNTRGGTREQHAEAGRQSHKNDGSSQG